MSEGRTSITQGSSLFDALRNIAAYARKNDFSIPCANIADALDRVLESHSNDELRVDDDG